MTRAMHNVLQRPGYAEAVMQWRDRVMEAAE